MQSQDRSRKVQTARELILEYPLLIFLFMVLFLSSHNKNG